jgi:hypothetical protein
MKVQGEWLVLAERVIHDSLSGNLSVVSCLSAVATVAFPSTHPGFAVAARFVCVGERPSGPVPLHFRLIRLCDADPPELVIEFQGELTAGATWLQVAENFLHLRLKRPERVTFRMDHHQPGQDWVEGPRCSLDILRLELAPEQQAHLAAEAQRLGLPPLPFPPPTRDGNTVHSD